MRLLFLITTCFFNIQIGFSQKFYASQHPDYISNVDSADFHFEMKHYEIAKSFYEKALAVDDYSFRSKFRLAICLFEASEKKGNEWLSKCAETNWEYLCKKEDNQYLMELRNYSDLVNWKLLEDLCEIQHSKLDSQLMKVLTEIDKFDQGIRSGSLTEADYEASEFYHSEMSFSEVDSLNLARMMDIFKKYGYPGKDMVGPMLSYTGFLVLQHADLYTDIQIKYFDLLKEAVEKRQAPKFTIAYLSDRVLVNLGECQDFGTQVGYSDDRGYYLQPVNDIENLDKRRQEYHIKPINDYLANWGLQV